MRIYYSEIKHIFRQVALIAFPIILTFSNYLSWGIIDNISLRGFLYLIGFGTPAAISAILSLYLFKNNQKKYWYSYSVSCEFFVQLVIFCSSIPQFNWGSVNVWMTIGTVLHLPTFYVDGLAIRKLFFLLAYLPSKLLRRLNIHLIPNDVEREVVFGYEESDRDTDLIVEVENKVGELNNRIQLIGSTLQKNTVEIQRDTNNLISDLYHLKRDYVTVTRRLQDRRCELKQVEHLNNLTAEQVDSLLSRISRGKIIDWIIGFILGFFASLLVQMLSGKIPQF